MQKSKLIVMVEWPFRYHSHSHISISFADKKHKSTSALESSELSADIHDMYKWPQMQRRSAVRCTVAQTERQTDRSIYLIRINLCE